MTNMDKLYEAVEARGPVCVGLDTDFSYLPADFVDSTLSKGENIVRFNKQLIEATKAVAGCYKVQIAYYEALGLDGMKAYADTLKAVREAGVPVIADIKRGDIGSTAEAYADAWLGVTKVGEALCGGFNADCVTLNGYMGADSVNPFLKVAGERDKSVFILAKTSNPGSGELQNVAAGEGDTVYGLMADLIEKWGAGTEGKHGYTRAGAVAGATYPEELQKLRARMPHTFLLVPGYGAQGGTAEDIAQYLSAGNGGVVNSSRGILLAYKKQPGVEFAQAAYNECVNMKEAIKNACDRL